MEAILATLTDDQRVETLNSVYQKGISTPTEKLAFSPDKLVYLKPFIGRLMNAANVNDLTSTLLIRQVVDELIADIVDEVSLTLSKNGNSKLEKTLADYGLGHLVIGASDKDYSLRQVA